MHPSAPELEYRVVVLAARAGDRAESASILEGANIRAHVCASARELREELRLGAGAALITEEALSPADVRAVSELFVDEPPWSDFPFIVVGRSQTQQDEKIIALAELGNVTWIERPLRIRPLLSVVRSALRSRRRQYEMRDVLQQLGETDRRKNEFLAMLGHELRNPLAAVRAALAIVQSTHQDDQQRPLAIITRQVRNLTGIVDDLLDVSRVLSGKIALRPRHVDLNELARHAVRSVEEAVRDRAHTLVLDVSEAPLAVDGDPMRLEQVLTNLLHNAIKYTPPRGHIRVCAAQKDDRALLIVQDDGLGIAPDMLGRIFEPFTQAGASLDRAEGGLGLGLPLVKKLVELHHGEISVTSTPKRGSTFTLSLPVSPVNLARNSSPTPLPEAHVERTCRVLLVDDNTDMLEMLRMLLERRGHDVEIAADGISGVEKAVANPPDVALVDIGLPGIDGYEVARQIRARCGSRPWLVAVTGYGQPDDRDRAMRAGFDRHLIKPVEPELIFEMLRDSQASSARPPPVLHA
jgi:signal transduction histidine kinase/ActR/RegA family two-component response regulator